MQKTSWYHQWFGTDYLQLYQHRSPEEAHRTVNWLISLLDLHPPARIFDLACGNGRHSRVFADKGFEVYGLDLSWPLLTQSMAADTTPGFSCVRGDMRYLPVKGEHFDLVLSLFTSFGYFKAAEEDQKVLQEISRVLKPGGSYVLDFLNVTFVEEQIVPMEETSLNGQRITILRWVDKPQQRIEKRILIHESEGAVREYSESVRLYTEAELRALLAEVDIEVGSVYGNYDGSPLKSHSPRLILSGRKHG